MVVNHAKQYERLRKIAWEAQSKAQTPTSIHFPQHIDTKEIRYGKYHIPTLPVFTKSAVEDVVMTDAYYEKYDSDISMINSEIGDVESFIDRLKWYFGRHHKYYKSEPTAMLYFSRTIYKELLRNDAKWTKCLRNGMTHNLKVDEQIAKGI